MVALNTTLSFLLSSWSYFYGPSEPLPIVQTQYGRLEGGRAESRSGRSYYEFLGIPFAKPPTGDLRFAPPQLPDPWEAEGVRRATSEPYECIQYHVAGLVTGAEDCLYLNVYTHSAATAESDRAAPSQLAPVMVYLHGGIFMLGGSRIYGARYFMDHDIMLVVVQYRLGALGFLNTGDGLVAGNMGLKDQTMALRWVRDNIHAFGGDPNRVTLVGQSAGAACAHLHMMSPMSRGLFQRVVLQSGNALAPWAFTGVPVQKQAERFGNRVGCPTNSTEVMVRCLKEMDVQQLVEGHSDYPYQAYERQVVFGPTVDSGNETNTTFLEDTPQNLLRTMQTLDIPMLQGVNDAEGLIFAGVMLTNETLRTELTNNWTHIAPKFLGLEDLHPRARRVELAERIRDYYFGCNATAIETEIELSMDNLLNLTQLLSDRNFFQPLRRLVEWKMSRDANTSAPMYLYYYTYKGEYSFANFFLTLSHQLPRLLDVIVSTGVQWVSTNVFGNEPVHYGAGHADEIFMLFKLPILGQHELGSVDYEMSRSLVDTWVAFLKTGVPKAWDGNGGEVCWPAVGEFCPEDTNSGNSRLKLQFMRLDNASGVIEEPFFERVQVWEESLGLNEVI